MRLIGPFIAVALAVAANAQDAAPPVDPEIAAADKAKALSQVREAASKARQAEIEAEAALEKARFAFLPTSPAEGKVTLGEGAGASEGAMLTTIAIQEAGRRIAKDAKPADSTILIGGSDALDLSALLTFDAEAIGVETQLKEALAIAELPHCAPSTPVKILGASVVGAGITALAGMLRTDTEIRSVKTQLDDGLLVRAVFAEKPNLIVPKYRATTPISTDNAIVCKLSEFAAARALAQAKLAATPPPAGDAKARLEAAVKRSEDFYLA